MINKCTEWCSHRYSGVVARVFISALFIVVGFSKLVNFSGTAKFIGQAGLPMPTALTVLAIIFELGGGLMLLFGLRKRIAINMLIVFTVIATALFHLKGITVDQLQQIMLLKNLAIIGGLLAIYKGCGCGHSDCKTCTDGGTCKTCTVK